MYAVFEDGSRQYRVSEGDVVQVDYRVDAEPGAQLEFNRVLLYRNGDDTRIGQPLLEGLRILAEVVDHPSIKVQIQHFRRRKNYRRLRGHRQHYTRVRVRHILLAGMEPPSAASAATETPASATGEAPSQPATPPPPTPAAQAPVEPAAPPPAPVAQAPEPVAQTTPSNPEPAAAPGNPEHRPEGTPPETSSGTSSEGAPGGSTTPPGPAT